LPLTVASSLTCAPFHFRISFASYHDPRFEDFGPLRVLNEDRVAPRTGFPTHPHSNAEIVRVLLPSPPLPFSVSKPAPRLRGLTLRSLPPFGAQFSYVLSGELTHKDSLGNVEVLKRGEVQFTSAGSGIRHSEYNDHPSEAVHFLQYVLFCAELWNQV
jgi:redox-sensitive bicupin YhaK (pirin superfamily)